MQASLATGSALALFCLVVPIAAQTQTTGGPSVTLTEVTVKKDPKVKGVTFFGPEGVEIKLLASIPGKPIIAMDKPGTVCTSFQDDKGGDLEAGLKAGFFHWASMSTGHQQKREDVVTITIKTSRLPTTGAGSAKFDGTLSLVTAAGTDVAEAKVALEKGTEFEVAGHKLRVGRVKSRSGKLSVTLESSQSLDGIQKIEFVDNGTPIKADGEGSGRMGFGDKVTYSKSFGLHKALDAVTIKVTYYKDLQKVAVPLKFDLRIGL